MQFHHITIETDRGPWREPDFEPVIQMRQPPLELIIQLNREGDQHLREQRRHWHRPG
jgi:hypothetical protein